MLHAHLCGTQQDLLCLRASEAEVAQTSIMCIII